MANIANGMRFWTESGEQIVVHDTTPGSVVFQYGRAGCLTALVLPVDEFCRRYLAHALVQWSKVSRDDYRSEDGRFAINRMPAAANAYARRDEWVLVDRGAEHDVYRTLAAAKKAAEQLYRK